MKTRISVGKAVTLALFGLSIASCDNRLPFGRHQADSGSLQSSVTDGEARAFYQARQWKPAWDKKAEKALASIIGNAMVHGLKPSLFLKDPLPRDADAREAALTKAAISYASALARGYVDPRKLGQTYTIPRARMNVGTGLADALEKGDLEDWYASLPPQTDEYRALSDAHVRFLKLAEKGKPEAIPAGKKIKPGGRDSRVPLIAAALAADGYLSPPAGEQPQAAPSQRYSPALAAAVRRLQADYGLKPDGVVGEDTLELLNAGPAGLARQVAIAMERLRWLERTAPATRIDVNTAATVLDYWRGDKHVDRRNVVTGEPDKQTPQIQAPLFQLVANPKWRVPDSIAEKEIATKGTDWLASNGFTMENGRYVQGSGPKNSLGQVKFDMQDKQAIYLHDTPAKALFGLPERHRSHGCVRVHNALDFAALLAGQDDVLDKFMDGLQSGDETYVKLKTPIQVRLLYHTAFLEGGRVQFRPDVYGWDDEVARALGFERGPARKPYQHEADDVGP